MQLPDVSKLLSYPAKSWRALARRLRDVGLTPKRVAPVVGAVAGLHPAMRAPVRTYHLRRIQDPAGYAMRMFLFNDPVGEKEARTVLGTEMDAILKSGLVERRDDGTFVSPFVMSLFNEMMILSDELSRGGAGVMGFGDGTIDLCRAAFPDAARASALELGCGAGTCALLLAAAVKRVVATDIDPRAITLARVNALLNGIENIEFREGDGFAPAAGERFDIVASQPPFVPLPEGTSAAPFLHGGSRGDEMTLGLLAQIGNHLTPRGRAILRLDWPDHGAPLGERVRAAAGPDLDVLVLAAPAAGPDEHTTAYAAGQFPSLDARYEEEVTRRSEHLAKAGIRGFVPAITVLQPARKKPALTEVVKIGPLARAPVTSGRIDRMFAARALAGESAKLLVTSLRVPEGTVLAQEQVGPGAEVPSKIFARFSEGALVPPMEIDPEMLFLATFVHEAPNVKTAVMAYAEKLEMEMDAAVERALPQIESALLGGLLEAPG